jgi:aryl-alcohol dehydrogenase-like predicted oxidoreductase
VTLPQQPLGSSHVMITKTGFGAWAIGGGGWAFGWGPQDDAVSLATMRHALELGLNWIDTAAVYGLGIPRKWSAACCANGRHPIAQWSSPSVD